MSCSADCWLHWWLKKSCCLWRKVRMLRMKQFKWDNHNKVIPNKMPANKIASNDVVANELWLHRPHKCPIQPVQALELSSLTMKLPSVLTMPPIIMFPQLFFKWPSQSCTVKLQNFWGKNWCNSSYTKIASLKVSHFLNHRRFEENIRDMGWKVPLTFFLEPNDTVCQNVKSWILWIILGSQTYENKN